VRDKCKAIMQKQQFREKFAHFVVEGTFDSRLEGVSSTAWGGELGP